MNVKSTQIDQHLYEIQLYDFRGPCHDILPLLEQHQHWKLAAKLNVVPDDPGQIGNFQHVQPHPLLLQYQNEFLAEIKDQLFDILLSNEIFVSMHREKTKDWMLQNVNLTCNFYVVYADYGIDHTMHIDRPLDKNIALGLIYFVHETDPGRSTIFRDWNNQHNVVVTTGYQHGWLLVNGNRSLHQTCNTSKHNRYGMKFQISLN
jgi:hypothetical protein